VFVESAVTVVAVFAINVKSATFTNLKLAFGFVDVK
jgi:hypothetical protein